MKNASPSTARPPCSRTVAARPISFNRPQYSNLFGLSRFLACALATAIPAFAQNIWNGSAGDTNWSTAGNWSFNAIPSSGDLVVFDNVVPGYPAAMVDNIVDIDFTVNTLNYGTVSTNGFHTTLIPAGRVLNLVSGSGGNAILVGTGAALNNESVYSRFVGAGTLNVTNTTGAINAVQGGANNDHRATLDLSGLTNFSAEVDQVLVGALDSGGGVLRPMAALLLAETNVVRTAAGTTKPGIMVAAYPGSDTNVRGTQQLFLGNHNVIHADVISMGGHKSVGQIVVRSGVTNGYTLVRGSAGGTDRVKLMTVGDTRARINDLVGGGTSAASTGTFDSSGTTLDLSIVDLMVPRSQTNGNGVATGTLTMDRGTIDVDNFYVGFHPSPAAQGNGNAFNAVGTVNLNDTATVTVNNDLVLGRKAGTNIPTATVSISTNATLNVKGNVVASGGNSTLALNGGTLDLQPSGDLTPGNATVSTLSGSGTIANAANVTNSVALTPGDAATAGILNVNGNLVLSNTATMNVNLASSTTVGSGVNDLVSVTGNLTLNNNSVNLTPVNTTLAVGSYRLMNYTGTRSGTLSFTNPTRYTLGLDHATAGQINLTNAGGSPSSLTWRGSTNGNWSLTNTNWNNNAERFFQLDAVTFDANGLGTNVALVGPLFPSSVTVNANTNYFFTGSGRISGGASLTKSGTGILRVNTANDFTGPVTISAGMFQVGNNAALGSTNGGTTVASGATLDVAGASFFNPGELITIAGTGLSNTGAVINTGAAQNNAIRYLNLSANATVRADNRFDVRGPGGSSSFSGAVNLNGFTLTKLGAAQMSIVDAYATNAGSIEIAGGVLSLTRSFVSGPGYINLSSNYLFIENFTTGSITKPFISAGGVVRVTGGTLTLGVPVTNLTGVTFDNGIVGGNPISLTLAERVVGAGGLVKSNNGTLLLDAANTYSGATTITSGGIKLGTNGSIANSPRVALFSGTMFDVSSVPGGYTLPGGQLLTGSGSVLGDVVSGSGTGIIPGTSAGTLTFSNRLTLDSSSNVFELSSDPSQVGNGINDLLLVNSNLTLSGVNTIKIVPLATLNNVSPYTLMQYAGTLAGGAGNLSVGSDSRYSFSVVDPGSTPGVIQVSVAGSGASANLVWQGGATANPRAWDTKVTSNWLNSAVSDIFYLGDNVTFDDTAVTNIVNLIGPVQPAGVVMNNSALNYTLGGSGSLLAGSFSNAGPGTLTFTNTGANAVAAAAIISGGAVTLANPGGNTFASGLAVDGGTLNIFNTGANAFTQPLSNNAGLVVFNQPVNVTFSDQIADDGTGLGTVTKQGSSTLTVSGDNTNYNGLIVVSAGTFKAGRATALGTATGGTTVASGATLDINGQSLFNPGDLITIAGTGVGAAGAIVNSGAAQNNALRAITLSADATISAAVNRWDVRGPGGSGSFSGAVNLGGFTLTKLGTARISVVDANVTDAGSMEITGGTLAFTRASVGGEGYINMGPNLLLLENNSVAVTFSKPLIFNGGTIQTIGNAITITSPITNLANLTADLAVNLTEQATITGPGSLTKIGAGTLILAETNDYTGGTLISAGGVQIGANGTTGNLPPQPGGVLTNNGTLVFNRSDDITFTDQITGAGGVQQIGGGTVFLTVSNSYSGQTFLNTLSTVSGGAALRISHPSALGNTNGNTRINGNTTGLNRLELIGNITIAEPLSLDARQAATADTPHVLNVSGNNTLTGPVNGATGGSQYNFQSDADKLTVAGNFVPPSTAGTRVLKLMGPADGEWSGIISNSTDTLVPALVEKLGAGTWTLSGANVYRGSTTVREGTFTLAATGSISNSPTIDVQSGATFNVSAVSGGFILGTNQTLMGNGSIMGNVTAAGTVAPGASVGTLTFANNLTLSGTNMMELDRLAPTNADLIVANSLTYGGLLVVTNIGDPLQSGDIFNLLDWTTRSGSFTTVQLPELNAGLGWVTSNLTVNGTIQVVTTVSTTPTNLTFQVTGNTLEISWPGDHIGWRLEAQTNALGIGISNNWSDVPNSTTTNQMFIPINTANGTVFFRLAFP